MPSSVNIYQAAIEVWEHQFDSYLCTLFLSIKLCLQGRSFNSWLLYHAWIYTNITKDCPKSLLIVILPDHHTALCLAHLQNSICQQLTIYWIIYYPVIPVFLLKLCLVVHISHLQENCWESVTSYLSEYWMLRCNYPFYRNTTYYYKYNTDIIW